MIDVYEQTERMLCGLDIPVDEQAIEMARERHARCKHKPTIVREFDSCYAACFRCGLRTLICTGAVSAATAYGTGLVALMISERSL